MLLLLEILASPTVKSKSLVVPQFSCLLRLLVSHQIKQVDLVSAFPSVRHHLTAEGESLHRLQPSASNRLLHHLLEETASEIVTVIVMRGGKIVAQAVQPDDPARDLIHKSETRSVLRCPAKYHGSSGFSHPHLSSMVSHSTRKVLKL